ncbi:uncharacterized protein [Watersipora subatra]|uniref:uncharacterized protein n=1 Tax=Watersipora subatra TaxID=2589382 RepID=UPI00355AEE23
MLCVARLVIRPIIRQSHHDFSEFKNYRHLHRMTSSLFQHKQQPISSQLLISLPPHVDASDKDNKLILQQLTAWSAASIGQSDNAIATMFEELLESIDQKRPANGYLNGVFYIIVLSHVQNLDSSYIRDIMCNYLNRQPYSALGSIYHYAVREDIEWLKRATQEKMLQSLAKMTQGSDLVTAYFYLTKGLLQKEARVQLESKTKELSSVLSPTNIIRILHNLALSKTRSTDVMKRLVYSLQQQQSFVPTEKQLSNVFFSASVLSATSPRMLACLDTLTNNLVAAETPVSLKNAVNMVISMGKLRYHNRSLLATLCSFIEHPKNLSVQQFASVLSTCHITGVLPDNLSKVITKQLKAASSDMKNVQYYLDIAWSLLVFGIKSEAICKDLLSEERITLLTQGVPHHTATSNYSKLLNICTVGRVEYQMEMPSSLLACSKHEPQKPFSAFHNTLGLALVDCLGCDAAFVNRDVWFPTGNLIDFRYLYDTEKQVVVSPSNVRAPGDVSSDKEEAASHLKWVAVFGHEYHHYTIGLNDETPLEAKRRLAETQLQQLGYHVVAVKESEFKVEADKKKLLKAKLLFPERAED